MEISCSFRGCSCGCTSSDYKIFKGEAPEIYTAIAYWAQDYLVSGNNMFSKLKIPEESKEILKKVNELDKKIYDLKRQKSEIVTKIGSYEHAANVLKVNLPDNIKSEVTILNENKITIDNEIDNYKKEIISLIEYNGYNVCIDEDDE